MRRIVRSIILCLVVLAIPLGAGARVDDAGPLLGCPPGVYRFLVTGDPHLREIDLRDGNAAALPSCHPSKAQFTVGEFGSSLLAEFPTCEGSAQKVKLEGRIHGASCQHFDGTLQAGKEKARTVHGDLVRCQVQYPNESERKTTVARAVDACMAELKGDPWKDAQDFGKLYYAVQAKLGCSLDSAPEQ
jgi:hypothetical protein